MENSKAGVCAQDAVSPKMAQVRLVVSKDGTGSLTWERGMLLLAIYMLPPRKAIALNVVLGLERIFGKGIV